VANFNKVFLMGNLTRDPELRYSGGGSGGTPICKFGLAVNRQWRNQAGESQEETCFIDLVVFGRQGETCNEYLSKGRPVFVEGRLSFSSWEDRETGAKRSKLEVVAERVQFLGSRNDSQGGGGGGGGGGGWSERRNQGDGAQAGGWDNRSSQGGQQGGQQGGSREAAPQQPASTPNTPSTPSPASGGGGGYDFDDIPF
jgi:single-strand DNA-binding protein